VQLLAQLLPSGGDDPRASHDPLTVELLPPLTLSLLELTQLPLRALNSCLDARILDAFMHPSRLLTPRHTGRDTAGAADRGGIHAPSVHWAQALVVDQLPGHLARMARPGERHAVHAASSKRRRAPAGAANPLRICALTS